MKVVALSVLVLSILLACGGSVDPTPIDSTNVNSTPVDTVCLWTDNTGYMKSTRCDAPTDWAWYPSWPDRSTTSTCSDACTRGERCTIPTGEVGWCEFSKRAP